jgi:hypothetical protein
MEFRHATSGAGRLGLSGVPDPRRGASNVLTCRMASRCRLGALPHFPRSLVKAPTWEVGFVAHERLHALHQKDIDWAKANLNHQRNQLTNYDEVFALLIYWPCR